MENDTKMMEEYSRKLKDQIEELRGVIDGLFETYGDDFADYFDHYLEQHLMLDLPFEVPYDINSGDSAVTARNLELYAKYLLDLIRGYFGLPYPYQPKRRQGTLGEELSKIDAMEPDERASYLKSQDENLVEAWVLHQLEERRKEEALRKLRQQEEAVIRYSKPDEQRAEELARSEDVKEGLRKVLKLWLERESSDN